MNKVTSSTTDSFRERGSKFIGYLFPTDTKENFGSQLDKLKSKYPDATHHCYAWRIHPAELVEFSQDDGEPDGTAGLPILNQLKSYEVVNTGIVVVRYYGVTNLGKSGLIEAYGRSAEHCLQKAELQAISLIQKVEISYPYAMQNAIEKLVYQFDLEELESSYTENVSLILACPLQHKASLKKNLKQLEHRGIEANLLDKDYM